MRQARDGLYQYTQAGICAGFVVRGGWVIECAPVISGIVWIILAKDQATWIGP